MTSTPQSPDGAGASTVDGGGERTNRFAVLYPWAQRALVAVPVLALAGPFASVRPGAAGFPYFYRILWFVGLIVAVPLFWREVRHRRLPLIYTLVTVWFLIWAPITLLWSPARGLGRTEVLAGGLAMVGSWVVLVITRGTSRSLRLLRWGWLIAFAVTMVVVAWEWYTGRHLDDVTGIQDWVYSAYSVAGLDTNPNGLSNGCVAMVAVMGAQLIREVNARRSARAAIDAYEDDQPRTAPYGDRSPGSGDGPVRAAAPATGALGAPDDTPRRRTGRGAPWRTVVLLAGMALAGFTVYLTGSRAGILSLMLLYALAAVWCLPTRGARLAVPAVLLVLTAALPVIQDTTLNQVRPPAIGTQAKSEPKSGHYQDSATATQREADVAAADALRKELSTRGLHYVATAPLQGHGAGAALQLVAEDPDYEKGLPEKQKHILNLHNTYLEMGVNYGLLGLLPILLVPLLALAAVLRPRHLLRTWPDPVVYECLGILLALLITSIITSTSIGSPTFWLLAAYATALAWNYVNATRAARAAAGGGTGDDVETVSPTTEPGR